MAALFLILSSIFSVILIPASALLQLPTSDLHLQLQDDGRFQNFTTGDFALVLLTNGDSNFVFGIVLNWEALAQNHSKFVWCAVLDHTVTSKPSLIFNSDGNLMLKDSNGSLLWCSDTTNKNVSSLELLDNGNLVLNCGNGSGIAWQSFDHPTDTLVEGQILGYGEKISTTALNGVGMYILAMEASGLVLSYSINGSSEPYWMYSHYQGVDNAVILGHSCNAAFNATLDPVSKELVMFPGNSAPFYDKFEDACRFNFSSNYSLGPISSSSGRAILQLDAQTGNLHAYALNQEKWERFDFITDSCFLPNHCSICSKGKCSDCVPSGGDLKVQCANPLSCNSSPDYVATNSEMEKISGIEYFSLYSMKNSHHKGRHFKTEEECWENCLKDCNCAIAYYWKDTNSCLHEDAQMGVFIREVSNQDHVAYVRINKSTTSPAPPPHKPPKRMRKGIIAVLVIAALVVALGAIVLWRVIKHRISKAGLWVPRIRFRSAKDPEKGSRSSKKDRGNGNPNVPSRIDSSRRSASLRFSGPVFDDSGRISQFLSLQKYSYDELVQITRGFSTKLADRKGNAYLGVLSDGSKVAVKRLESKIDDAEQFRSQVCELGMVCHGHTNLANILGFCADGFHRLIIYELMNYGSLAKLLFEDQTPQSKDWKIRYGIILGTLRALVHLHDELEDVRLHLDLKPENILLDGTFTPKLSDLWLPSASTGSNIPPGYIAPEWLDGGAITAQSDMFSYGVVLLEMITGRHNFVLEAEAGKRYLPTMAIQHVSNGGDMHDLVDPRLGSSVDANEVENAIRVAIFCVQEEADQRPSSAMALNMLEGKTRVPNTPLAPILAFANKYEIRVASMFDQRLSPLPPFLTSMDILPR